ncbi:MAG: hypothetical protein CO113_03340 [Elusimicrobia bacterium CG_4_9_14_3_um_filter_62_55]|nr:MAG: hypothetical protein CO113_03340 [Elusimicrobia bacterium CG_4_9_14_3_um_filter_62_55]
MLLFRRLGDGSGFEAAPIDVTDEVLFLDRLSDKLDTEDLGEFKTSNISITVDNSQKSWEQGSTRFPNGPGGFLLFRSRIVVRLGLKIGGLPEIFDRFTGQIEDTGEASKDSSRRLDVYSALAAIETTDADKAGVLVPNALLGIGDNVQSEFFTPDTGVGEVIDLRLGGESLRPGLRWSVGQLDDPNAPAKVSFESSQPDLGVEVRADYRTWKRDQRLEQVVADLLATVPDVPVAQIDPVVFDPPPQREIVHTTEGDFLEYIRLHATVVPEDPPPQNDASLTLLPFETTADFQATQNQSGVNFLRVKDAVHPQYIIQYEGDDVPDLEHNTVEGRPILPKDWQEFLPGGDVRVVEDSLLKLTHNGGADYFIFGQKAGATPDRYMSIRIKFASINGSCFYGGTNAAGAGAVLEFVNINQVRLHSSGSTGNITVNLTAFHVFEVVIDTAANLARLLIDGVQVATRTLGEPTPFTGGNTVQFQVSGNEVLELDFMRYADGTQPPLASLTFQRDMRPHLSGLTTFGLITTLGPFFAEFQGAPRNARYFWSHSEDGGFTFTPEVEIPNGGDVGDWTNTDQPDVVRLRVEFRGGSDTLPSALIRLAFPSLSHVIVDGGDGLGSWDTWQTVFDANDGGVQVFTASHNPAGIPFLNSFHQALGMGDTIVSDDFQQTSGFGIPRFMSFIILMNTAGANYPLFREGIIRLTTTTILITLANLGRGRSALSVVEEVARISDSEIGVNGSGAFFYRDKSVSPTPEITLDDENVLEVLDFNEGWDRVFNSIKAEFGDFRKIADSASEGDPAPTSERRFGTRSLPVGGGNLLFQRDVDLATAMAKRYFPRHKEPKRRLTLRVRWMPEVELGDRALYDVAKPRRIGPSSLDARVIGVALDPMGFETELELQEI